MDRKVPGWNTGSSMPTGNVSLRVQRWTRRYSRLARSRACQTGALDRSLVWEPFSM